MANTWHLRNRGQFRPAFRPLLRRFPSSVQISLLRNLGQIQAFSVSFYAKEGCVQKDVRRKVLPISLCSSSAILCVIWDNSAW